MGSINDFVDRIIKDYPWKGEQLSSYSEQIREVNGEEFWVLILRKSPITGQEAFVAFLERFEDLSYEEWLGVFDELIFSIQKHPSSFEGLLFFFYRMLEIDLIHYFAKSNRVDDKRKKMWLEDYRDQSVRFKFSEQDRSFRLKEFDKNPSLLQKIQSKLLEEGALKAEKIGSFAPKVSKVDPPKSWKWVETL